jgi:hypothetical protein
MTDDKPDSTTTEKIHAALDDFMATVLRHLRTGQHTEKDDPLDQQGLVKSRDELQNWHSDVPGSGGGGQEYIRDEGDQET